LPKFNTQYIRDNFKKIILLFVLTLGVLSGVFLVQKIQEIREEASSSFPYNEQLLSLRDDYYTAVFNRITDKNQRLTGEYSVHADLNKDGVVNSLDYASLHDLARGTSVNLGLNLTPSRGNPDQILSEMEMVAKERKRVLLEEARNNPPAFIQHAILADERNSFPEQVKYNLEEFKSIQGTFQNELSENFETDEVKLIRSVTNEEDGILTVHLADSQAKIPSFSSVRIQGSKLDANLIPLGGNIEVLSRPVIVEPLNEIVGEYNIGAVLVDENSCGEPTCGGENSLSIFDAGILMTQIDFYYSVISDNKLMFNATNAPPSTVILNPDESDGRWYFEHNCNDANWYGEWGSDLYDLMAARVDLSRYHHLIFFTSEDCPTAIASGGTPTLARIGDFYSWLNNGQGEFVLNSRIAAHELGHNLRSADIEQGINHASLLLCEPYTSDCNHELEQNISEKGDLSDVMATLNYNPWNIPHALGAGWLNENQVSYVDKPNSGYHLDMFRMGYYPNDITSVVVIARDDGWNYYLSLRQNMGLPFEDLPNNFTGGLNIHLWNGDMTERTRLIDLNSGGGWVNAPLNSGDYFRDNDHNIHIEYDIELHGLKLARVTTWGSQEPDPPLPTNNGPLQSGVFDATSGENYQPLSFSCSASTPLDVSVSCGANCEDLDWICDDQGEAVFISDAVVGQSTTVSVNPGDGDCVNWFVIDQDNNVVNYGTGCTALVTIPETGFRRVQFDVRSTAPTPSPSPDPGCWVCDPYNLQCFEGPPCMFSSLNMCEDACN